MNGTVKEVKWQLDESDGDGELACRLIGRAIYIVPLQELRLYSEMRNPWRGFFFVFNSSFAEM